MIVTCKCYSYEFMFYSNENKKEIFKTNFNQNLFSANIYNTFITLSCYFNIIGFVCTKPLNSNK